MKNKVTRYLSLAVILGLVFTLTVGFISMAQKEKDVYTVGVDANFPPYTWVEKGEYKGFDVEIIRAIAEVQDLEIKIVDMPWETIIPALGNGKIDMLVSGLTIKCDRDEIIDYTQPYWRVNQEILVRKDSDLNAITAMSEGHTVGAQRGTTGYMWIQDELVKKDVNVEGKAYEDYTQAIKDLEIGRIDAVLVDTDTANAFLASGRDVKNIGTIPTREEYAYAVTEGDPYGLLPVLNEGMEKLFESGRWNEIFKKYFDKAPPKDIPLERKTTCE